MDVTVEDDGSSKLTACTCAGVMFTLSEFVPKELATYLPKVLLGALQHAFETLMNSISSFAYAYEKSELFDTKTRRLSAVVSFLGHLYVRELVKWKVLRHVFDDLISKRTGGTIVCACDLLLIVGRASDPDSDNGHYVVAYALPQLESYAISDPRSVSQDACDAISKVRCTFEAGRPAQLLNFSSSSPPEAKPASA